MCSFKLGLVLGEGGQGEFCSDRRQMITLGNVNYFPCEFPLALPADFL